MNLNYSLTSRLKDTSIFFLTYYIKGTSLKKKKATLSITWISYVFPSRLYRSLKGLLIPNLSRGNPYAKGVRGVNKLPYLKPNVVHLLPWHISEVLNAYSPPLIKPSFFWSLHKGENYIFSCSFWSFPSNLCPATVSFSCFWQMLSSGRGLTCCPSPQGREISIEHFFFFLQVSWGLLITWMAKTQGAVKPLRWKWSTLWS